MSVSVLYNGQKKSIKVSPMQPMQYVVNEAAASFSVLPDRYCLKHKKVTVDPSQPFRFTGLANNVVLELCPKINESSTLNNTTKIAANIQPYGTFTDSFASTSSLIEILQHFISKESLPVELLACHPEVIYLRNSYTGDNLNENRLNTLGLAGQNAKFQIRFKKDLNDILSSTSSVPPLKSLDTKLLAIENNNDQMIIEGNEYTHSSPSSESTAMNVEDTTTRSIEQPHENDIKANDIVTDNSISHTIITITPTVSDNSSDSFHNEVISTTTTITNSSDYPVVSLPLTPECVVDTSPTLTSLQPQPQPEILLHSTSPSPIATTTSSSTTITDVSSNQLLLLPPSGMRNAINSPEQSIPMEIETKTETETGSPNPPMLYLPFSIPTISSSTTSSLLLIALSTMVVSYEAAGSSSSNSCHEKAAIDNDKEDKENRFLQALRTLFKYINNIYQYPQDHRFRQIRISNPTYQKNIGSYRGAHDFLLAIGFLPVNKAVEIDVDVNPVEGKDKGNATEEWLILPLLSEDTSQQRQRQRQQLEADVIVGRLSDAIKLLKTTADHYNFLLNSPIPQSKSNSTAPAFVFDPYKPAIFRTNPQPRDNNNNSHLSVTDMRLQSLLKKRAEILASTASITSSSSTSGDQTMDHSTTIISFPGSTSSISNITTRDMEEDDTTTSSSNSRGDNRLIAQALAKKVVAAATADKDQDEGPPLTTSALREVWALEKARVYSTVLVRVSFPDRVVIQGTFHPESMWKDIIIWLTRDCLRDSAPLFELSCSDPSLRLKRKSDIQESEQQTLSELGLVPAALLRLKWRDVEEVKASNTGSYLKDSLLLAADGKQMSGGASASSTSYPTGISLVSSQRKDTIDTKKELGTGPVVAITGQPGITSEPKKSGGGGKPKWFKT